MADESDIQIISDHFTSQVPPAAFNEPIEDRFRMYHGNAQPASVSPASYHAFQKAYDDLKTRFNEVANKNTIYERQLRACKAQISESSMASNSASRFIEDGDEAGTDINDRQGAFQLRRRYVELVREHQLTLDELHKYQEELSQTRKRINDLENTNRGLLQDNQCMMAKGSTNVENGMTNSQIVAFTAENECLNKLLKHREMQLKEKSKTCVQLQKELDRVPNSPMSANLYEENTTDSDTQTDENWARFAHLQVQIATKEAQEMRCLAQQQHALLVQLKDHFSDGTTSTALRSLMTRSAPAGNLGLQADPNIVSVEVPSNAEQFPIILQPRGTTARRQQIRLPFPKASNTGSLTTLQEHVSNIQLIESRSPPMQTAGRMPTQQVLQTATGVPHQQTARPAQVPTEQKVNNTATGMKKTTNGTHEALQCTEDVFMQNVMVHKNDIVGDIIEEQRRQPVLPNKQTYTWGRYREPVGTVFSATPERNSRNVSNVDDMHPVRDFTENEAIAGFTGSPASQQGEAQGDLDVNQQMEEHASLRRDVPAEVIDDRSAFSFVDDLEEYETTLQELSIPPESIERALFTFELNENTAPTGTENRHHPSAFNQQPRQLNIDRNYNDDELRRTGSYDNTASNRNINEAGTQRKPSTGNPYNPPVLNNDPLWTPKAVPTQNLYSSHTSQTEPRHTVITESQRVCPVCDMDFPSTMDQDAVQDHVNQCLSVSEANPNPEPIQTPTHGPASTGAMAREEKQCPICFKKFPDELEISRINAHVNSHFDNNPLNFEIIDPTAE